MAASEVSCDGVLQQPQMNDEILNSNLSIRVSFVIRASSFFRHSSLGISLLYPYIHYICLFLAGLKNSRQFVAPFLGGGACRHIDNSTLVGAFIDRVHEFLFRVIGTGGRSVGIRFQ